MKRPWKELIGNSYFKNKSPHRQATEMHVVDNYFTAQGAIFATKPETRVIVNLLDWIRGKNGNISTTGPIPQFCNALNYSSVTKSYQPSVPSFASELEARSAAPPRGQFSQHSHWCVRAFWNFSMEKSVTNSALLVLFQFVIFQTRALKPSFIYYWNLMFGESGTQSTIWICWTETLFTSFIQANYFPKFAVWPKLC